MIFTSELKVWVLVLSLCKRKAMLAFGSLLFFDVVSWSATFYACLVLKVMHFLLNC